MRRWGSVIAYGSIVGNAHVLEFFNLVCGGEIQQQLGDFSSPDYPDTPYIPPDQHDDLPRCHWRIRPQSPDVTMIWLTFRDFFLGRREEHGHCRYVGQQWRYFFCLM